MSTETSAARQSLFPDATDPQDVLAGDPLIIINRLVDNAIAQDSHAGMRLMQNAIALLAAKLNREAGTDHMATVMGRALAAAKGST